MISALGHMVAGVLAAWFFGLPHAPALAWLLIPAVALLPDLDTPRSLIGRVLPSVSRPLEMQFGHRTVTHSLLGGMVASTFAYAFSPRWWLLAAAAYGSHIVVDLIIGHTGVQLFWPSERGWVTLTGWRGDGPAPQALLIGLLIGLLIVINWPRVKPLAAQPFESAMTQPTATPSATPTATPKATATPQAAIELSFELPPGVSVSALRVREGDSIAEGQTLAAWDVTPITPTPAADLLQAADDLEALATMQPLERAQFSDEQAATLRDAQWQAAEDRSILDGLADDDPKYISAWYAAQHSAEQVITLQTAQALDLHTFEMQQHATATAMQNRLETVQTAQPIADQPSRVISAATGRVARLRVRQSTSGTLIVTLELVPIR